MTTSALATSRLGPADAWRELASRQKPAANVPWYMRVVNRKLGRAIASAASPTRITPDGLTAASFVAFLAGSALLVLVEPGVAMAIVSTLLLQLGFALDSADGQLARLRGTGSRAGEWLDHVVDTARHLMFHLVVLVGLHRFTDVADAVLLLPMAFAVVAVVRFFAQILAEQLADRGPAGSATYGRRASWIQAPADTGLNNLLVLLWPFTTLFLIGYGVFAALNALLLAATLVRRHRELARGPA